MRCEMNRFRYTETSPEGKFSMFLEQSYEKVRYVVRETGGGSRQYYTDNQLLFELYDYLKSEDMENWRYLDAAQAEEDVVIQVEIRVGGRMRDFGSARMPVGGIEKLRRFRAIAAAYEDERAETKPFTVTVGGKKYRTVRGTGNSVGAGAVIDFGSDKWWLVEGFAGHYELTAQAREAFAERDPGRMPPYSAAILDLEKDGSLSLQVGDDAPYRTAVDAERRYGCTATAMGGRIQFEFCEDGRKKRRGQLLRLRMSGLPYPETFAGYDLILEKRR